MIVSLIKEDKGSEECNAGTEAGISEGVEAEISEVAAEEISEVEGAILEGEIDKISGAGEAITSVEEIVNLGTIEEETSEVGTAVGIAAGTEALEVEVEGGTSAEEIVGEIAEDFREVVAALEAETDFD